MKTKLRKLFCIMLACFMLASVIPMTASATDTMAVKATVNSVFHNASGSWGMVANASYYLVRLFRQDNDGVFLQSGVAQRVNALSYTFSTKDFAQSNIVNDNDSWKIDVEAYSDLDVLLARGRSDKFNTDMPVLAATTPTLSDSGVASWTAVENATKYGVLLYERSGSEGNGTQAAFEETENTSFDFTVWMKSGYAYRCKVYAIDDYCIYRNSPEKYSDWVNYSVITINSQPTDSLLSSANIATFTVDATGEELTYQWCYDGSAITSVKNKIEVKGETTDTLKVKILDTTLITNLTKNFTCKITDKYSKSITTQGAKIHIHNFTGIKKNNGDGTHSYKCRGCSMFGNTTKCSYTTQVAVVTEPTCLNNGVYTCSCVCGATKNIENTDSKLEHSYTGDVINNGDNTHSFKCVNGCNEYGSTADCTPELRNCKPATCGEDGYTGDTYCSVCNAKLATGHVLPKEDEEHFWDEGVITTPATCNAKGIKTYTCTVCNTTKTEDVEIDPDNHGDSETEIRNMKPATCIADGYSGDLYCEACEKLVSGGTVIAKSDDYHAWGDGVVVKAATCAEEGATVYTCSVCKVSTYKPIAKTSEHTWNEGVITTEPTCAKEGVRTFTCTVCEATRTEPVAKSTEHTWNAGTVTTAPTCAKAGVKTYTCTVCETTKTETIAKIAHTYKTVTTAATLTKNGKTQVKCSVCGAVKNTKTIAKISSVKLSKTAYTYTGKALKPTVTVKDSNGKAVASSNYTVTYKNNTNVGKATVTVKFKGNYSGTKTLTFTISPKATTVSKVTSTKKGTTTVTVKKQATQTTGYEIQYSTSSKFTAKTTKIVKITSAKTLSKTIAKLTSGKTYYFRVRTYKTVSKANYTSDWSKSFKTKIK